MEVGCLLICLLLEDGPLQLMDKAMLPIYFMIHVRMQRMHLKHDSNYEEPQVVCWNTDDDDDDDE